MSATERIIRMSENNEKQNDDCGTRSMSNDLLYAFYEKNPDYKRDIYNDLIKLIVTTNFSKDNSFIDLKAEDILNRNQHAIEKYHNDPYFAAFCKMQVAHILEILHKRLGI